MNAAPSKKIKPPAQELDEREIINGTLSPKQLAVEIMLQGPQTHTLLYGGSRSSKTTAFVRSIVRRASYAPGSRHAILRRRRTDVQGSIWLETLPTVFKLFAPWMKYELNKSELICAMPNDSMIVCGGLDDKERVEKILGREYATIYLNECSEIPYDTVGTVLTRLAQRVKNVRGDYLIPRMYYDLNPTGTQHWTAKIFINGVDPDSGAKIKNPEQYRHETLHPRDNEHNLPPGYIDQILANLPEKKRKRYLDGQYQNEIDGALWTLDTLARCRCNQPDMPPIMRIVVAVDPSGASGEPGTRSDDIGIVVAGKGADGRAYVLADLTLNAGPSGWGQKVIFAYAEFRADVVVAEINYGGAMVEHVVQTAAKELHLTVPYKTITASRGKHIRAEPISVLYERDQVRHVGQFHELEDEMTNMSVSGYQGSKSPNRLDALVWALTELMLDEEGFAFGSM